MHLSGVYEDVPFFSIDEPAHKAEAQWGYKERAGGHGSTNNLTQKMIIEAEERGDPRPEVALNFPPGFF